MDIEALLATLENLTFQDLTPLLLTPLLVGLWGYALVRLWVYKRRSGRLQQEVHNHKVRTAKIVTLLKQERRYAAEKLSFLEQARDEMRLQFSSLAQQIFEDRSEQFSRQNSTQLATILQPFQDQLHSFRSKVNDIHISDTRERASLQKEISHLTALNNRINDEAANLTRALKGDKKAQGNWGELVLERVLEKSGLRKGHEYATQGGYRDGDNRLFKPDVLVHLPDNRDIIIDSKVSLVDWERYINAQDEGDREKTLKRHIQAIRTHIQTLSEKDYSSLKGLQSLDFVLMFMPIEAAFATATQYDDTLLEASFSNKIIIVTPTTLLVTLRTIENIWRLEQQHKNSQEIARLAGSLYDKLRGFLEDMEKIGKQLSTTTATYESAMNKLTHGRGNVIAQAGRFTELGVKAKKEIPKSLTDQTETDFPPLKN